MPRKAKDRNPSRDIPLPVRCQLWGMAAGRCEFRGCNLPVYRHPHTKEAVNISEAAHIIGFSNEGPRGEKDLSAELAKDVTNLMLLCRNCHRTVDANKATYSVDFLRQMKTAHEQKVEINTGVTEDHQSHVVLFGANISKQGSHLSFQEVAPALFPEWCPASTQPISIGMVNSALEDHTPEFWALHRTQLESLFVQQVRSGLATGRLMHLSVFARAPQPLLVLLGYLLSDIPACEVYQLHREPPDWCWQDHPAGFEYKIHRPTTFERPPALVFALSATILPERVHSVPGGPFAIWAVTIPTPNNDFLKSREQLRQFRQCVRPLLDEIKTCHGDGAVLHVFPAMPVATAVEFGRIIMPKADLLMRVYDQNSAMGGFIKALDIRPEVHNAE